MIAMNMRTIKTSLTWGMIALMAVTGLHAQEDNLVPNSGFENSELKKLKGYGQLEEFSENWFNANETLLDLYAEGMKSEKINIPNNLYGEQGPSDGVCYAGLRAYSKDTRLFRNYYEVELMGALEKNQLYCVSFDVSLSDLSRYAVNGIGAVLSDRKVEQGNTGVIIRDMDVNHHSDKVMSLTDGWETICGTMIGTGQEDFLMIGAFASDNDMEVEKIKRPSGISGTQKNHAYYYLDNIKVFPITAKSECACTRADEVRTDLVYGSSVVLNESMSDEETVSVSAVYYAFLKRNPTGTGQATIVQMAEILKANPSWKLGIVGHADEDEFNEGKINPRYRELGAKRSAIVIKKFAELGIGASRLVEDSREDTDPASTRDTDISRAQNRRVTFEIIK